MLMENGLPEVDEGEPESTPVLALNDAHDGKLDTVTTGVGDPVATMVKELVRPRAKVVDELLVIDGPTFVVAGMTVTVRAIVALGESPLEAVTVTVTGVLALAGGVPERVPLLALNAAHEGKLLTARTGAGVPDAVMVKLPATPTVNRAALPLVIVGATPVGAGAGGVVSANARFPEDELVK
jgi:hypothetical protein